MATTFPFTHRLSLTPLAAFWRSKAADKADPLHQFARQIARDLDRAPVLEGPLDEVSVLDPHWPLLERMMMAITPPSSKEIAAVAVSQPFSMRPFYTTPAFDRLGMNHTSEDEVAAALSMSTEALMSLKALQAYFWVLIECYGLDLDFDQQFPLVLPITDEETGLPRYYKIRINPSFCALRHEGDLPPLSPADLNRLLEEPTNLDVWKTLLPPDQFVFEGIVIYEGIDITEQHLLSKLKDDLLKKGSMTTPGQVSHLQERLRSLLRKPDLELGFMALTFGDLEMVSGATPIGRSLLLADGQMPACPLRHQSTYAKALKESRTQLFHDLQTYETQSGFETLLMEQGFRNLLLAPLFDGEQVIGFLELASPNRGDINAFNARLLDDVASVFATAMSRTLEDREDRVQAIIKEEYTALHPVVEWRFREAALARLERMERGHRGEAESIVFEGVHPLYGLADIRGSSTRRNAAIQADLVEQVGLALLVIVEASTHRHLPILDALGYRLGQYISDIGTGLSSGDDQSALAVLRQELEPLFDHLATFDPSVEARIRAYKDALDPELGVVYRQRKAFEDSVMLINDTIGQFIDQQEATAQGMFPHYYERYKTDGVDYNIYIGQSLLQRGDFDPIYLRNLRLWQLMMTCGVAWEMETLKPSLPMELDVAHLILVQDIPLSIRFRMDEKQFDVDGAYNIRYEIVKKRIDKARIKGTGERLTQPGYLAIVYSQPEEAREYLQYLDYLSAASYTEGEIEHLVLEDLQGVQGLRALRVAIASTSPDDYSSIGADRTMHIVQTLTNA
ncbi:MAG: GAF domain-containing protein [Bacteroidota bacterium]